MLLTALSFHDTQNLISRYSFDLLHQAARPEDLEVSFFMLPEAEVKPQIALGKVAATTAYFVHPPAVVGGRAVDAGTDGRAVRLSTDALHLKPVIVQRAVAPQQL